MSTETTHPETPTTDRALHSGDPAASTRPDIRSVPGPAARGPNVPAPAGRPTRAGNGRPGSPAEMRREIERTRARMSGTLDALEARIEYERQSLEEKKDELVDRATLKGLRRRLSREPWRSMAIAFAAGYIIAAIRD